MTKSKSGRPWSRQADKWEGDQNIHGANSAGSTAGILRGHVMASNGESKWGWQAVQIKQGISDVVLEGVDDRLVPLMPHFSFIQNKRRLLVPLLLRQKPVEEGCEQKAREEDEGVNRGLQEDGDLEAEQEENLDSHGPVLDLAPAMERTPFSCRLVFRRRSLGDHAWMCGNRIRCKWSKLR